MMPTIPNPAIHRLGKLTARQSRLIQSMRYRLWAAVNEAHTSRLRASKLEALVMEADAALAARDQRITTLEAALVARPATNPDPVPGCWATYRWVSGHPDSPPSITDFTSPRHVQLWATAMSKTCSAVTILSIVTWDGQQWTEVAVAADSPEQSLTAAASPDCA